MEVIRRGMGNKKTAGVAAVADASNAWARRSVVWFYTVED